MSWFTKIGKYLPILGVLLFFFVLWKIGVKNIFGSLIKANVFYLSIYILLFIPVVFIQIYKWYYIVKLQKIEIKFVDAFKFHMVSSFLGSITPGKIGLLSKIFFLKKNANKSTGECSSSVLLDKLFDMIILFVFAFFGSLFLLKKYNLDFLIGLFLVLFIFGIFLLFNKKIAKFFLKWIYNYFIPNKFKERIRLNFNSFYDVMPPLKKLITPFLITLFCWIIIYSQTYILAYSFNINIPYISFIFILSMVTLITLLPITIFGMGTREISLIALLSGFGIDNSNILAFSISLSFFTALVFFSGYMLYAKEVSLNLKDDTKTNQEQS